MRNKKNAHFLKIFVAITFALALTNLVSTSGLFLASSPRLNSGFLAKLQTLPATIGQSLSGVGARIAALFPAGRSGPSTTLDIAGVQPSQDVVFKDFVGGVKASEDNSYIKIEKGAKVKIYEYTTSSGQKMQIMFPQ